MLSLSCRFMMWRTNPHKETREGESALARSPFGALSISCSIMPCLRKRHHPSESPLESYHPNHTLFKEHSKNIECVDSNRRRETTQSDQLQRRVTISRGPRMPPWMEGFSPVQSDLQDLNSAKILNATIINVKAAYGQECSLAQPFVLSRH
ncbi:uncharacterized protein EI90DRAFT_3051421, partial [Cantharellus anzutake]|uniref:uncharacterized protein n=1 Tax=Cantharellus anzutake TaxID=1750568 RepID=UPI001906654E